MTQLPISKFCGLHKLTQWNSTNCVCSIRSSMDDKVMMCLSDGIRIWKRTIYDHHTAEFEQLRCIFPDSEIKVTGSGETATVTLQPTKDGSSLSFNLTALSVCEGQAELSELLFHLSQRCLDLEKQLGDTENKVTSLQTSAAANSSAHRSVFDIGMDAKKRKTQPKPVVMRSGMSVINPGSRKHKQAHAVEYD